ncbi:hypothetical protein [Brucella sp. NBRC 12950]|uniref:hypothetical protein n=1 Tax=Brucella sp. NBRC 12950 TaxID=2994518 RepID=UPI0025523CCB|nr:hypothetical protein [Brucella sp. NBRC 12950]
MNWSNPCSCPAILDKTIARALVGLSRAPQTVASKAINDLSDAGIRIVDQQEG